MKIRVILADDHVMLREGIKQLLEFDQTIQVVAEANDGVECLEKINSVEADVLLLDINMPRKNGLDTLQEIKKNKKKIKVLILTVHEEVEYLVKAIDLGVEGYILKDSGSMELKKAIHAVLKGESYIQPNLIPALNHYLIHKDEDKEKLLQI